MACTITVNWSNCHGGTSGGVLEYIYIEGTAYGCNKVKVTLSCEKVALPSTTVEVSSSNDWYVKFTNLPVACLCGCRVLVLVECDDGVDECINDDHAQGHDLSCKDTGSIPIIPPVNFTNSTGDCDSTGKRQVTVSITLPALAGNANWVAELHDPAGMVLGSVNGQPGPVTLGPYTSLYPGGTTQNFELIINQPNNQKFSYSVILPVCGEEAPEPPTGGGAVSGLNAEVGECDATGHRQIIVTWFYRGYTGGDTIDVVLRNPSGIIVDSKNNAINPELSFTSSYPGGTTQNFEIEITKPVFLAEKRTISVQVPACNIIPDGNEGEGEGGDGGGKCGSMVFIVGGLLALGASLTALLVTWYLCLSIPPIWIWYVVLGVDAAAAISIAIWYIICHVVPGCECPTKCDWLQIGTMVSLATATVFLWLSNCCATYWVAAGFGAAYLGALAAWIAVCNPSKCAILTMHTIAIISGAVPAIANLLQVPQIAACGSPLVNAIAATVGGVLAAASAACKANTNSTQSKDV